jgi:hypothetical protein
VPFALAQVVQIGFIVHQVALVEPKIGRPDARFAVALTTSIVEFFCGGAFAKSRPQYLTTGGSATQSTAQSNLDPLHLVECDFAVRAAVELGRA